MNARGTRRPHARTPRSRDVNVSRRGGGGDDGGGGFGGYIVDVLKPSCAVVLLALAALPAVVWTVAR